MLRDVNIKVTDGQLSAGTDSVGVHIKIGASPMIGSEPILIKGSYDAKRIKSMLGNCPLADACMDSVENGANIIYCIPALPSKVGVVSAPVKTGTGTGTLVLSGIPNNSFDLVFDITETGGLNKATFTYSLNDGISTSEEITMPLSGTFIIPDTGITVKFAEGGQKDTSFILGDQIKAKATASSLTNSDILNAVGKIKNLNIAAEFVHIVGETSQETWAAVSAEQKALFETQKIAMLFLLEAYKPKEDETAEVYTDSLISARKGINNYDIQVVVARCNYVRMDKTIKNVNMAGIVCGWYASASVQKSIGKTSEFSLSETKGLTLMPPGIEDELERLDYAGFLTFRKYIGLEGLYVTNARVFCPEGSDYKYAEHVRVKNKIIRKIRKEALLQLQSEVDLTDVDGGLQAIGKILEAPLDEMVAAKEISAGRIIIPAGQDILKTEKVSLKVRFTPKGYAREFEIDLGMEII